MIKYYAWFKTWHKLHGVVEGQDINGSGSDIYVSKSNMRGAKQSKIPGEVQPVAHARTGAEGTLSHFKSRAHRVEI